MAHNGRKLNGNEKYQVGIPKKLKKVLDALETRNDLVKM